MPLSHRPLFSFPPIEYADPNGLLCIGYPLTPEQTFSAHANGVFPWFNTDDPTLWWSPDPRAVFLTDHIHCSRSLAKAMRRKPYQFTFDTAFDAVIYHCSTEHGESWITDSIITTYTTLYHQHRAHSAELWLEGELIGGLYGVCLDRVFCAESMFSRHPNASKMLLVELGIRLHKAKITHIDTQMLTPHLASMGAFEISRTDYKKLLGGNPNRLRARWIASPPHLTLK